MREFLLTILQGKRRIVRRIKASSTVDATINGITSTKTKGPFSISCKPVERTAA